MDSPPWRSPIMANADTLAGSPFPDHRGHKPPLSRLNRGAPALRKSLFADDVVPLDGKTQSQDNRPGLTRANKMMRRRRQSGAITVARMLLTGKPENVKAMSGLKPGRCRSSRLALRSAQIGADRRRQPLTVIDELNLADASLKLVDRDEAMNTHGVPIFFISTGMALNARSLVACNSRIGSEIAKYSRIEE